jgi:hypothetical protein
MEIAKEKTSTINFEHNHYVVGSKRKTKRKQKERKLTWQGMTAVMNFYSILIQATARVSFIFTSQFVSVQKQSI